VTTTRQRPWAWRGAEPETHRGDLADEAAAEVDDAVAQVAERAAAGELPVEPPDIGRSG
jgi:hypothetical protein